MAEVFAPYVQYADSGFEWVGPVPSTWRIARFKHGIVLIESGKRDAVDHSEVLSIGGEHVGPNGKLRLENLKYVSEGFYESSKKGRIQDQDILVVKDGATIGKAAFVDSVENRRMLLNEHVYRIVGSKYYYYYVLSSFFQAEIWSKNTSSAQEGLNLSTINNIPTLIPSLEERTQIAKFLDYETAKIDALIEKQQQLIALLKEKRQAVISHAVTKGSNPDAPMRDSGVEWLGEVPAHWEIRRAKYLLQEQKHEVRPGDEIVTSFRDGQVCLRSRRRSTGYTMAILEHGYQGIRRGDLVVHSMDAFAGAIGVSEDDGRATPEYVVVRPFDKNLDCEYYARILRVMAQRDFIFVLCPSVRERAPRFRFARLQEVLLPVPPAAEQAAIAAYLRASDDTFTQLLELTEDQVAVLQERRAALTSAAVTGKIDVRDWQPPQSTSEADAA